MPNIKSEYIKTLTVNEVTMADDITVVSTKYTDVWYYQVPPKQRIFLGNGQINLGVDDRGTFKADYNTEAPAAVAGVSRLLLRDANGIVSNFIREDLSVDYETGVKVGKGGNTGNERNKLFVTEDEYIVGQLKSDTASIIISEADSTLFVPVTIQAL